MGDTEKSSQQGRADMHETLVNRAERRNPAHRETTTIAYDTAPLTAPQLAKDPTAPQRARGRAACAVRCRDGKTVLADLAMSGSAKLMFPRPRDAALDAVFLNAAGGVTGGDHFELEVRQASGTRTRLTTQAAERIYKAPPGPSGVIRTRLHLEDGAQMAWLPQETILFDGAALDRHLQIDMARDARLLSCETLVFGRAAMGETVRDLRLCDRVDVRRDGALIFADRLRLDGDAEAHLSRGFVAGSARAMASVILAAPDAADQLDPIREMLPPEAGASAISDDLVFVRMLAPDSFDLRRALVPLLQMISADDLPRPWML